MTRLVINSSSSHWEKTARKFIHARLILPRLSDLEKRWMSIDAVFDARDASSANHLVWREFVTHCSLSQRTLSRCRFPFLNARPGTLLIRRCTSCSQLSFGRLMNCRDLRHPSRHTPTCQRQSNGTSFCSFRAESFSNRGRLSFCAQHRWR